MADEENIRKAELIEQFISITTSDVERARFFLESSVWDVQLAVQSFFENEIIPPVAPSASPIGQPANRDRQEEDVEILEERPVRAKKNAQSSVPASSSASVSGSKSSTSSSNAKSSPPAARRPAAAAAGAVPKKAVPKPRFGTLSDLNRNNDSSGSDSGNESPQGPGKGPDGKNAQQAFYVGGGEHSGQQVLGPRKVEGDKVVDRLFKEAKARGAVDASTAAAERSSAAAANGTPAVFQGAGMRLGDAVVPSQLVPGSGGAGAADAPRLVAVRVALYRNGFTVEDGPLRDYDAPESKLFLDTILKQQVPRELTVKYRDCEIDLHMENFRNQEYVAPKTPAQAFSGRGYLLGGVTPNVTGAGQVGVKAVAPSSAEGAAVAPSASRAKPDLTVDESQPTTRIQIRLLNGQRLVARFNNSHTVADVRRYVIQLSDDTSEPFLFTSNSTIPAQKLLDESLTLEKAGLLNASISQAKCV